MKEALDNCWLKIAVTETLKTWKEEEAELQRSKDNRMDKDSDSSDESLDEQLSDVREAIGILNNYLEEVNSAWLYSYLSKSARSFTMKQT